MPPYPIHRKLVISIASSALFDLSESDEIFREKGEAEYRKYQRYNQNNMLNKGVAFPFIKRFLSLNTYFTEEMPVEVILLSRNDPDTGLRVFKSIQNYGLNISRAGFLNGKSPFKYIPAFNSSLFLSSNAEDVKKAIDAGFPAGTVLASKVQDETDDLELRIAFDFDGVIVDDQAEAVYQKNKNLDEFYDAENKNNLKPHRPGPLFDLFKKISIFQKKERKMEIEDRSYKRIIRTAIVTARNAPAHERVINTLREWDISVDEAFFLGNVEKRKILEIMKPHIYFDDQMNHLKSASGTIPSVHIPFGIANIIKNNS